jgi:hypothetical protein
MLKVEKTADGSFQLIEKGEKNNRTFPQIFKSQTKADEFLAHQIAEDKGNLRK